MNSYFLFYILIFALRKHAFRNTFSRWGIELLGFLFILRVVLAIGFKNVMCLTESFNSREYLKCMAKNFRFYLHVLDRQRMCWIQTYGGKRGTKAKQAHESSCRKNGQHAQKTYFKLTSLDQRKGIKRE